MKEHTLSPSLVELNPEAVRNIHQQGGTILGSSRGTPPTSVLVDRLKNLGINTLFVIGGDGTMRGATAIWQEAQSRGYELAVVGVPKTIDNDIPFVKRTFGFETAVGIATSAVLAAHTEAECAPNGIGLIKLMGRHSGYIAANAALASGHANFCLVPEVPFQLDGQQGLLAALEKRLAERDHAVIVVAEGAGQDLCANDSGETDASGNAKLGNIGEFLQSNIKKHFASKGVPVVLKYIDPSYIIRAAAANPADQLFCIRLAQAAVHAAMAGKTGMMIGYWHGQITHVPLSALAGETHRISPQGELWADVLESTGQPANLK